MFPRNGAHPNPSPVAISRMIRSEKVRNGRYFAPLLTPHSHIPYSRQLDTGERHVDWDERQK
jgi:hypothetical protein